VLNFAGLRPIYTDSHDSTNCIEFVSYLYTLQVIILMGIGYVLQYMACFRRDRGFGYKTPTKTLNSERVYDQICHGSLVFSYIVPNTLHLLGYLYAVKTFRSSDDDQLPSLMERVFLSLSNLSDGFISQKKLVKVLWIFVSVSLVWMVLSFISVNFMMAESTIDFKWMDNRSTSLIMLMKVLLIICTLWHDMIQATVISNYCLQAQLLSSYIYFLKAKLLQNPVQPVEWMRDIQEFKKLLQFFNHHLAPAVCIFTIINMSCSISGILWLFNYDHLDNESMPLISVYIINVGLWLIITFAPFIQAARLTNACKSVKSVGHEVRTRPFVHQTTPGYKLDSILLYASSLKIHAKLFGIPITGTYLCFFITLGFVTILTLGQLHYLNALN